MNEMAKADDNTGCIKLYAKRFRRLLLSIINPLFNEVD